LKMRIIFSFLDVKTKEAFYTRINISEKLKP
jgi:hypothetical protein